MKKQIKGLRKLSNEEMENVRGGDWVQWYIYGLQVQCGQIIDNFYSNDSGTRSRAIELWDGGMQAICASVGVY